ncbi:amidohydrolase [Amycolatopsis sp. FDAARGOS 1241]|uniref:amidohydrolase family protein n=1 Tax=Amycolatopsis sp. FDAARGOS 1241 TaxID=2778070 RepID=UPI00194FAA32|nr:amidohydrolase family protein [Amycolatopsis sp. FDAARGOS 1241]QRP43255.1 amidohydrolase [Amycolatopsis sp. FDAARGOS 1241]
MDIIDTHTHVISPDAEQYPVDPIGGKQSEWSKAHPVDIEGLVRALDDAGIAKAVVVQASTVYGHDNRYVAEALRRHPDRFAGVYSIDAMAPDAVERIDHWQGLGFSGFRLFTTGTTMPGQADWLGHEDSFPAWAHAEQHDIPVCLQMTIQGLPKLRELLDRFPKVRVLLDHCARPDLSDGRPYRLAKDLFDLAAYPGVHLKLTHRALAAAEKGASTVKDFLTDLVAAYGANRLVWGSNFPAAEGRLPDLLAEARETVSVLPDADVRQIFGGTAAVFYPGGNRA